MIDAWAVAALCIVAGSIVYPFVRRLAASLSITIGLVIIFMLEMIARSIIGRTMTIDDFPYNLAFSPFYLITGDSLYTLITSVFIHADFLHIIFNALWLVFLGLMLEERIGTTRFIAIFLISGIAGNLAYGIANLGSLGLAVGASGAIFGILGAMLVLYPRERLNLIIYFIPLRNIPVWLMVLVFLAIQLLLALSPSSMIAWEAHIGGLVAGMLVTPLISNLRSVRRLEHAERIDIEKIATTREQREILLRIQSETIPEVRRVWVDELAKTLSCPICQSRMRAYRDGFRCRNGHRFKISR
ncbi:MAG: rhomboid family intramembrane serine protease [Thermoplasmata archaeon]